MGRDDVDMDAALAYLLAFVQAHARSAAQAHAARQDSAMDEEQWWAANAPLLEKVLDPHAYPLAVRVGTAAGTAHGAAYSPEHAWDFGLGRVLSHTRCAPRRPGAGREGREDAVSAGVAG
ncbi:hypothetical protein ACFXN2_24895 [Streptomyces kronopolitis]|uniref:hypothetical protein n=1 Tax=Streptomyces kronopolitis TaxID=1612435 RepID=UPI0036C2D195